MTRPTETPADTARPGEGAAAPARIGRFRVDAELGAGAMGVVYKGYDEAVDRPVALKTVRADLLASADGEAWLARFRNEARAAARCLHPNVVALFEYGESDGLAYLVMEYVRGHALQAFLARGVQFGTRISLHLVQQVLAGLGAAHDLGVVHRDIKPSNIMVLENGTAKVADFGVARLESMNLSRQGSMVGTPSYMAPEQFEGRPVDPRTDLFAVGILLQELLTGRKPFPGETLAEVMRAVLTQPPLPPEGGPEPLPAALTDILATALARDPGARFPDAEAFRRALGRVPVDGAAQGRASAAESDATRVQRLSARVTVGPLPPGMGERGELDAVALRQAGEHLMPYLGPVAGAVVNDVAARVSGVRQLYNALAEHIPDPDERAAFLRRTGRAALGLRTQGGAGTTNTGGSAMPSSTAGLSTDATVAACGPAVGASAISDDQAEHLRRGLAEHMGPIAGVLVRQAVTRARSPEHLAHLLADHIQDPAARSRFLASANP